MGHALATEPTPPLGSLTLPVEIRRLPILLAAIAYRLAMDFSYSAYISPVNNSLERLVNNASTGKLVESWLIMLVSVFFLPTRLRKPSDFLLYVVFFFPYLSQISLYNFIDGDRAFVYATFASFLIIASTRNINMRLPRFQISHGKWWMKLVSVLVVALLAVAFYFIVGTDTFQFNLGAVYKNRDTISDLTDKSPILLGYVGSWVYRVLNIFLLALALRSKRYFLAILICFVQLYFFGITQQKSVMFYPVLAFGAFFLVRKERTPIWFFAGMGLVLLLGIAEEFFLKSFLWNQFIVRRVIWIPARLDWGYYSFFKDHGLVHMSNSILRTIFPYPYQVATSFMMGIEFFQDPDVFADTGFLGTGYMQFGLFGMIFYAAVVGLLFLLTDLLTLNRMPAWMGAAITISAFFSLFNDSDLPTSLLTNGLALSFLVLFVYGKTQPQSSTAPSSADPSNRRLSQEV